MDNTDMINEQIIKFINISESEILEFKQETGFSVYFYKDIYTEENLRKMELNKRQIKAVMYVKEKGKITNKEYQQMAEVSESTATRELAKIVSMNLFEQQGTTGKGTFYILKKGSNG